MNNVNECDKQRKSNKMKISIKKIERERLKLRTFFSLSSLFLLFFFYLEKSEMKIYSRFE